MVTMRNRTIANGQNRQVMVGTQPIVCQSANHGTVTERALGLRSMAACGFEPPNKVQIGVNWLARLARLSAMGNGRQ